MSEAQQSLIAGVSLSVGGDLRKERDKRQAELDELERDWKVMQRQHAERRRKLQREIAEYTEQILARGL